LEVLNDKVKLNEHLSNDISKVGLYVITFNSPKQFETLIKSMLEYDPDFINKPRKFLLDNSTDLSTTPRYIELCKEYGFEHIKKDNIGIMGGRIFVAEHFNETDLDYYYWFEDDMAFYPKNETCKNGFNRYVPKLYQKSLEIIQKIVSKFPELGFNWISDDEELDMEIVAQIVKNKDFNALFSSFYSSRESNENKIPDNDTEILNSQAFKNSNKSFKKLLRFILTTPSALLIHHEIIITNLAGMIN
jgi:hypothetical protein